MILMIKPYENPIFNKKNAMSEFILFMIEALIIPLNFNLDYNTGDIIGWGIVSLLYLNLSINLLTIIVKLAIDIKKIIYNIKKFFGSSTSYFHYNQDDMDNKIFGDIKRRKVQIEL